MLNEEIVFLDSDEDREVKQKMEVETDVSQNPDSDQQPSEETVSLDKENNPKEEQGEDIIQELDEIMEDEDELLINEEIDFF